jgi:hypothetical protein
MNAGSVAEFSLTATSGDVKDVIGFIAETA